MANARELADLARELAEIAGRTTDPETARLLSELIEELMTEIGRPEAPEGDPHGRH